MKGGPVDGSVLCPSSLQCHAISQVQVVNVLCQFFSSVLIDEDKGVVLCIVDVKLDPIFPRVIQVFLFIAVDQDMGGSGRNMGRGGDTFKERRGASILHGKVNIFFNFVSEGGYIGEMNNAAVLHIGDGKGECAVGFFHGLDWDHDVIYLCVHLHIVRVVPLIVEDSLA